MESGIPGITIVLPRAAVHERRDARGRRQQGGRAFDHMLTPAESRAESELESRWSQGAPDAGAPLDEEPGRVLDVEA